MERNREAATILFNDFEWRHTGRTEFPEGSASEALISVRAAQARLTELIQRYRMSADMAQKGQANLFADDAKLLEKTATDLQAVIDELDPPTIEEELSRTVNLQR